MTDLNSATWLPPATPKVVHRGAALRWLVLAAVMYLGSATAVRLFDSWSVRAQTAQLIPQGGPLFRAACDGCVSTPTSIVVWLTDWRAVLVWILIVVGAAVAVIISPRQSAPK